MPDISMCANKECPKKKECYRYMASPCDYQCYSAFVFKDGKCEDFWPITEERRKL